MLFEVPYVYDTKQSFVMLPFKCADVGMAKNSKNTHVWCESVRGETLLCSECEYAQILIPILLAQTYIIPPYERIFQTLMSIH